MTEIRPMSVYTGPAEVSWEQAAVEVLVYGRTEVIGELEGDWQTVFRRGGEVARELRQAAASLGSWHGAAGEVYRQRLTDLAARVDQVEADCGAIVPTLAAARQSLATAQEAMPVPSEAVDNLAWARMKGDGAPLGSGFFMAAAQRTVAGGVTDLGAGLSDEVRDWFTNEEAKARQVHATVNGAYEEADANAPKPDTGKAGRAVGTDDLAPTGVTAGGWPGAVRSFEDGDARGRGMPSGGLADGLPVDSASARTGSGGWPGEGAGFAGPADPGGSRPVVPPISAVPGGGGLAGIAPVGGSVLGAGSLGSGYGPGPGPGGGSFAGGGALGPHLGQAVAPSLGAVPMGATGAAGGRSGADGRSAPGSGKGTSRQVAGLAPTAGHGRTGADEHAHRSTWLIEDEDVWGAVSDASPPVLGAE
jgi:hypothetical protein